MTEAIVKSAVDSAEQYMEDVLSGKILACKWIKLAVERHKKDLKNGHLRGIYFDKVAGAKVIGFFCFFLKFTKGRWAGKPFIPQPWQCFILMVLFGWKNIDGTRRFKRAYIGVARKNGKSELMAGIELFMATFDGENSAEIYSVATKKDQAKIVFNAAKEMLKYSTSLQRHLKGWRHQINGVNTANLITALGSDADTLDGLNPSAVTIDEFHAHKNTGVYDVMWSAMGARENPLLIIITTAGLNLSYPCYAFEKDCKGILNGFNDDDGIFIAIYQLDEEDISTEPYIDEDGNKRERFKWADSKNYIKSNPNLGVSVKVSDLEADAEVAVRRLSVRREFLTKKCNIWYDAPDTWIKTEDWKAAGHGINESELIGLPAYAGMDLAQSQDFCSLSLLIPFNGELVLKNWFWIPQETVNERVAKGLHSLVDWIEDGLVYVTDGNATDYDEIEAKIDELRTIYDIKALYYDPYNATQLATSLDKKRLKCVGITQTPTHLGEAGKEFELGILKKTINHLNNPVLAWMANNVVIKAYPSGVFMVHKGKSADKIDGISSAIMAEACYLQNRSKVSVYASRGALAV